MSWVLCLYSFFGKIQISKLAVIFLRRPVVGLRGFDIREQLGGKWGKTNDGGYKITGIDSNNKTVNLEDDIKSQLEKDTRPTVKELYNKIKGTNTNKK